MTAAVSSWSGVDRTGLRPIDPRRDMRAVAGLIEIAFAGSLDASGRNMLRWMRSLGQMGWFGWLLSTWLLPPAARPHGFVWEVDGRLVGNASLLTVQGFPQRWVLSNVAVHPDFRRRGIARGLVRASVDMVQQRNGKVLILQVDHSSRGVLELYDSFGFSETAVRTTWVRASRPSISQSTTSDMVQPRRHAEWQEQWALARRVHPEGLIWPYPVTSGLFRSYGVAWALALGGLRHWVWRDAGQLLASITLRRDLERGSWRLILIVDPQARGRVEVDLLRRAIDEVPSSSPLILDYPAGLIEDQLHELGFRAQRTLTWMEMQFRDRVAV